MTFTQLEYIVAVDTHRHYVTAAESCAVTQPTLSMQIQKLENELKVLIFDRSKQPIVPTEIGAQIIKQARQVLAEHRKIFDIVEESGGIVKGDLHIGIIPTLAPYLLPLFLKHFTENYPLVRLHIQENTTEEIVSLLKKDLLDCGILASPLGEMQIKEQTLFYEAFVAYIPAEHHFYTKKTLLHQDLYEEELVLLNETHCLRAQVEILCQKNQQTNSQKNIDYQVGSIETLKRIAEITGNITLLPELSVTQFNEEEIENVRYFEQPEPVREISLAIHRNELKRNLIEALKQSILANIPQKMRNNEKKMVIPIQ